MLVALVSLQVLYRLGDLFSIASGEGVEMSPRMRRDWTDAGLLAPASMEPRGQRRGVGRYWTEEQVEVFRAVLRRRRTESAPRRDLANIPVAWWLFIGEAYVPLRQVRRALGTFVSARPSRMELERRRAYDARRRIDDGRLPDGVERLGDDHEEAVRLGLELFAEAPERLYEWARERFLDRASTFPRASPFPTFRRAPRIDELRDFACADLLIALGEVSGRRPGRLVGTAPARATL
jgi:hypothetical protein